MFTRDRKIAMLQKVPLFSNLSRRQLERIAQLSVEIEVPAGSRLATAGEPGQELVVIIEGHATVTVGRSRTVRLGPGQFFGEMSLVDGEPRSATIKATTTMRLLVVGSREFSQMLAAAPPVALKIMSVLSRRVRDAEASLTA